MGCHQRGENNVEWLYRKKTKSLECRHLSLFDADTLGHIRPETIHELLIKRSTLLYLSPQIFITFSELRSLKLYHCQLPSESLQVLVNSLPPQVENLSLAHNGISKLPVCFSCEAWKSVKVVDLSFNKLEAIPDNLIEACPNLETLDLQSNFLTGITLKISSWPKLRRINLIDNLYFHDLPTTFVLLERLEALGLDWLRYCTPPFPSFIENSDLIATFRNALRPHAEEGKDHFWNPVQFCSFVSLKPFMPSNETSKLYQCFLDGHLGMVASLIKYGAPLNSLDQAGLTPLLFTLCMNNENVSHVFHDSGMLLTSDCTAPSLHLATKLLNSTLLRHLLRQGNVDINQADHEGNTSLHILMRVFDSDAEKARKVATVLLEANAACNCYNNDYWTPVHIAVRNAQFHGIQFIVHRRLQSSLACRMGRCSHVSRSNSHKQGSCPLVFDINRLGGPSLWSPLHLAAYMAHLKVIRLLLYGGAFIFIRNKFGLTPYQVARGTLLASRVLKNAENSWLSRKTAFRCTCQTSPQRSLSPTSTQKQHCLSQYMPMGVISRTTNSIVNIVTLHATPDSTPHEHVILLESRGGGQGTRREKLEPLCNHHMSSDVCDYNLKFPCSFAFSTSMGTPKDNVQALLKLIRRFSLERDLELVYTKKALLLGLHESYRGFRRLTTIWPLAVRLEAVAMEIALRVADEDLLLLTLKSPENIKNLEHFRTKNGETPLHLVASAQRGHPEDMILHLLQCRILWDINSQDIYGQSALHFAAKTGNWKVIYLLLLNNANPALTENTKGWTPLHLAVANKQFAATLMLLANPALNIEQEDIFQRSPIMEAIQGGDVTLVALLVNRGATLPLPLALEASLLEMLGHTKQFTRNDKFELSMAHLAPHQQCVLRANGVDDGASLISPKDAVVYSRVAYHYSLRQPLGSIVVNTHTVYRAPTRRFQFQLPSPCECSNTTPQYSCDICSFPLCDQCHHNLTIRSLDFIKTSGPYEPYVFSIEFLQREMFQLLHQAAREVVPIESLPSTDTISIRDVIQHHHPSWWKSTVVNKGCRVDMSDWQSTFNSPFPFEISDSGHHIKVCSKCSSVFQRRKARCEDSSKKEKNFLKIMC